MFQVHDSVTITVWGVSYVIMLSVIKIILHWWWRNYIWVLGIGGLADRTKPNYW